MKQYRFYINKKKDNIITMNLNGKSNEYDVIIIGGGITGAGTARDCSLRGMRVLLLERFDFAAGATGRNHGLLHSGARYAVTDKESASECIKENMILRKIARHCVEENNGLFISLPEDDINFQSKFVESCHEAGIDAQIIDPAEARRMEPSVNPNLIGAVKVPDGSVDPFRLTLANIIDAKAHGAQILVYHEVTALIKEQGRVIGVTVWDHKKKESTNYYAPLTINAGGIWGHNIAKMAGIEVGMYPAKGSLLIFGHRVNNVVLNRCRKPADADILVPGDTICLIGTTSSHVGFDEVDDMRVTSEEVDLLLHEGEKLAPALATTRILRAYAGVRPLVAADNDPTGRNISRGDKPCTTMTDPLPGSRSEEPELKDKKHVASPIRRSTIGRHGDLATRIAADNEVDNSLVCECEDVSVGEVKYALKELDVHNMEDLRHRTRVGMGTCQGELCACRAAGLLGEAHNCAHQAKADLARFLNERWKGMYPVAWGEALREGEYTQWVYKGLCGMNKMEEK